MLDFPAQTTIIASLKNEKMREKSKVDQIAQVLKKVLDNSAGSVIILLLNQKRKEKK
jgi:hypothetical protein